MKDLWSGRFDSDKKENLRLWQVVKEFDEKSKNEICFIGYDSDDGVQKTKVA